jgi:hypothetical protein
MVLLCTTDRRAAIVPANDPESTLVHDSEYAYARDDEEMPAAT